MSAPHLRLVDRIVNEHGEIVDCPHCQDARAEAEMWEQDVLKLKRRVKYLETDQDAKRRSDRDFPIALRLFDYWREQTGHKGARFDPARIRIALAAVKLYREDLEKLAWVVQYGRELAYVDARGNRFDQFGLLFRDAEHIEKYARAWWTHCQRNGVVMAVRECRCGHPEGDHKWNRSNTYPRHGVCLVQGCECKAFRLMDDEAHEEAPE